jgi:hypothetical protein
MAASESPAANAAAPAASDVSIVVAAALRRALSPPRSSRRTWRNPPRGTRCHRLRTIAGTAPSPPPPTSQRSSARAGLSASATPRADRPIAPEARRSPLETARAVPALPALAPLPAPARHALPGHAREANRTPRPLQRPSPCRRARSTTAGRRAAPQSAAPSRGRASSGGPGRSFHRVAGRSVPQGQPCMKRTDSMTSLKYENPTSRPPARSTARAAANRGAAAGSIEGASAGSAPAEAPSGP